MKTYGSKKLKIYFLSSFTMINVISFSSKRSPNTKYPIFTEHTRVIMFASRQRQMLLCDFHEDPRIKIFCELQENPTSMLVLNLYNGIEIVITADRFPKCSYDMATCQEEYYYLLTMRDKKSKQIIEKTKYFFTKYNQQLVYENVIEYVMAEEKKRIS